MAIRTADAGDFDEAVRILSARMEAESGLLDRLLGVPAGSIRLSDPGGMPDDAARNRREGCRMTSACRRGLRAATEGYSKSIEWEVARGGPVQD
ncbi:hypothetical protein U5922_011100 [Aquicoccus sp. G2-2]|uniref:hypothetical protein n=1 Tax=Aquicoccus sp. G2-2 TaxID=3092120 RepID=UPI002ADFEC8E|nr:hypothetical protein [Aquicoccus sp. G2-2]MEA1113983.1 hypothetical protein [Aquicoccus sp. G2-2]